MFNVSSLLLDDALEPATPLTNGATYDYDHQQLIVPYSQNFL